MNSVTYSGMTRHAKDLFHMTWPMVIGVLSLMSFQLADSIYIARLGVEPLAVVGFTIPVYQMIIGIQVGIGIATTALISQRIGAEKHAEAKDLGGTILIFGTLIILAVSLFIWIFRAQILALMGGEKVLLPLISAFWSVFLISALVGAILYFGYSICRAHGDTKLPGAGMVVTSLLNIVLDPLFIFYFELGLQGAAYATICAFGVGLLLVYPKLIKKAWLSFHASASQVSQQISQILSISVPALASQIMPSISAILATNIVAGYGTEHVAAWGVGVRLEFFSIVLVLALTMSLPPMIGRYYGAGRFSEIESLVKLSLIVAIVWQLVLALAFAVSSDPLSELMADNKRVSEVLSSLVVAIPWSYAPLGVCMLCISICNAMGVAQRALAIAAIRLFICYLPCLILGSYFYDFNGLIAGAVIGNFMAGLIAWKLYRAGIKKASQHIH